MEKTIPKASQLDEITDASERLDAWIEAQAFKGYDPYDALNSPLLKTLSFNNHMLRAGWVQLFKRSPVNLRPFTGVQKGFNPKGMGLFLDSYLLKYQMTGNLNDLEHVRTFANWLQENASSGYHGYCWGYNFDWPNRDFYAPAGTPTVVNTAFIALAFLNVYDFQVKTNDLSIIVNPLEIARSSCDFVLDDLNRLDAAEDEICFSYTPLDQRWIHNASLLGAQLLAAVYQYTGELRLRETAVSAARYTARRQQPDGSWGYGEGQKNKWIDNFHTGFVLVSLKEIAKALETDEFDACIAAGYEFWKEQMFLADGAPKYYPQNVYPIDAHSVAQAIITFLTFADVDTEARAWAEKVAAWGVDNMQSPNGYFYYRINKRYKIRIPYMRWTQAWVQRALTKLLFQNR